MSAVLPHYKTGPANYQVATLIYGGQLVMPNTANSPGTTDLTVKLATTATTQCLGVAAADGNVLSAQTGSPNSYGEPLIDISVLTDYVPVWYGGVDIWVWYSAQVNPGQKLLVGSTAGTVGPATAGPAADQVVGICTHPGGVATAMLTQSIGGQGSAAFFLGRARIF